MSKIETQPVYYGKYQRYLHLASVDGKRDDYFFVVFHDEIIAKIYLKNERWYIWYCKKCYRFPVESFTAAIRLIEKEVVECMA